jgi:dephospho-CoA kinase
VGKSSAASMLRVGVTGGIGSGKSLVCALFAGYGVPVLSADEVARQLMVSDADLRRRLILVLGPSAYRTDGALDKQFVASRIFSDPSLRKKVDRLVHPKVEQEVGRRFGELDRNGHPLAIVEAALIFEAGFDKELDAVVVVDAPEEIRVKRVVERDHGTPEQVRERISSQMDPQQKTTKADYVIHNSGSLSELESSVRFLLTILTNLSRKQ